MNHDSYLRAVSIGLFILCIWVFFVGVHNIDLGVNLMRLGYDDVTDVGMFGVERTPPEMYSIGLDGIIISFILSVFILAFNLLLKDGGCEV